MNIHNPAILILMIVIFELECGGKRAGVYPEDTATLRAEIFDEFFGEWRDEVDESGSRRGSGLL